MKNPSVKNTCVWSGDTDGHLVEWRLKKVQSPRPMCIQARVCVEFLQSSQRLLLFNSFLFGTLTSSNLVL